MLLQVYSALLFLVGYVCLSKSEPSLGKNSIDRY